MSEDPAIQLAPNLAPGGLVVRLIASCRVLLIQQEVVDEGMAEAVPEVHAALVEDHWKACHCPWVAVSINDGDDGSLLHMSLVTRD